MSECRSFKPSPASFDRRPSSDEMIDPNHQPLAATRISTSLFGVFALQGRRHWRQQTAGKSAKAKSRSSNASHGSKRRSRPRSFEVSRATTPARLFGGGLSPRGSFEPVPAHAMVCGAVHFGATKSNYHPSQPGASRPGQRQGPSQALKDPGEVGGSDAGRCPGGRRCSCGGQSEEGSDGLRERAVRFCFESNRLIAHVAQELGIDKEALRQWVRQAEADRGVRRDLLKTDEREELKMLLLRPQDRRLAARNADAGRAVARRARDG
jgi:transposase-like protein